MKKLAVLSILLRVGCSSLYFFSFYELRKPLVKTVGSWLGKPLHIMVHVVDHRFRQVSGPNPRKEDQLASNRSDLPGLGYVDDVRSFASNEICINWNAPLVYLAIGLEALLSPNGLPVQ